MSNQPLSLCEVADFSGGMATFARGAANTKAGWVQYLASTPFSYRGLKICANTSATDGGGDCWLFDVGIGPSGSEQTLIPNLLLDASRGPSTADLSITLPVLIPAGSRLAVNVQDHVGSSARNLAVSLTGLTGGVNYPFPAAGQYTDYGTVPGTTTGTLVDPGTTTNTWGSWIEMTAATVADHNNLGLVWGFNQFTGSATSANYQYQIGVGPAGSEQPIAYGSFSYLFNNPPPAELWHPQIPAGSRLAMRAQASSVTYREMTAILYGG